ncbi:SWIM zinc finger family protein [Streptomyces sp. NPDC001185]|uniref:SWIM zinc finger family protein n=1 Tax=Streptomyces sp. NPDC001185 TaxID=3154380 RepID=UPI0033248454
MQTYTYLRPSAVRDSATGHSVVLETSGGATPAGEAANPHFFSGLLTAPAATATALLAVADVAAARYYRPTGGASLDPVVTADGDRLRLESFSGCCGVYARLDVLAPGLDGDDVGRGTTNVDVNPLLRRALAGIGGLDPLHLAIGPEELTIRTFDGEFVEKKVPLPERWLRGFAEAQVLAAAFTPRAEVPAVEVASLLRSLPRPTSRSAIRTTRWVMPVGRTLRPTTRPAPGAVCLPGPERLLTLQTVLRHATTVQMYASTAPPAADGATAVAWEVKLPGMRLTLMLSPSASRGFSGEGSVLHDLSTGQAAADAEQVSELLAWEPRIDIIELSRQSGLSPDRVRAALTTLGTSGQVGYDLAEEAYFHRYLPYNAGTAVTRNPRLHDAQALVADGGVRFNGPLAWVGQGDDAHVVRSDETSGQLSCTCFWWAKNRSSRGPCKHILAVGMARDTGTDAAALPRADSGATADSAASESVR